MPINVLLFNEYVAFFFFLVWLTGCHLLSPHMILSRVVKHSLILQHPRGGCNILGQYAEFNLSYRRRLCFRQPEDNLSESEGLNSSKPSAKVLAISHAAKYSFVLFVLQQNCSERAEHPKWMNQKLCLKNTRRYLREQLARSCKRRRPSSSIKYIVNI